MHSYAQKLMITYSNDRAKGEVGFAEHFDAYYMYNSLYKFKYNAGLLFEQDAQILFVFPGATFELKWNREGSSVARSI